MASPFDQLVPAADPVSGGEEDPLSTLRRAHPRFDTVMRMFTDPGSLASVRGLKALGGKMADLYSAPPGQQSTVYNQRLPTENQPFPDQDAPNPFAGAADLAVGTAKHVSEKGMDIARNYRPGEQDPNSPVGREGLGTILESVGPAGSVRAAAGGRGLSSFAGKPPPAGPEAIAAMKQAAPAEFNTELQAVVKEMQALQGEGRAAAQGAKEAGSHPSVDKLAKSAEDPALMEMADKAAAWRVWMKHNSGGTELGAFGAIPKGKKGPATVQTPEGEVPATGLGGRTSAADRARMQENRGVARTKMLTMREQAQTQINHPPIEDLLIKEHLAGANHAELAQRLQRELGIPTTGDPVITGKMIKNKLKELSDKGRVELLGGAGAAAGVAAGGSDAEAKVAEGEEEVQGTAVSRAHDRLKGQIETVQGEASRLEKAFLTEKDSTKKRELFRDMIEAQDAAIRLMQTGSERRPFGPGLMQFMNTEHKGWLKKPLMTPPKGREPRYRRGDVE